MKRYLFVLLIIANVTYSMDRNPNGNDDHNKQILVASLTEFRNRSEKYIEENKKDLKKYFDKEITDDNYEHHLARYCQDAQNGKFRKSCCGCNIS